MAAASLTAHAAGDAAAGEQKVAICAACHGADGNSQLGSNPKLAGQGEKYLLKQLLDVQSGKREIALMTGLLNNMSEQDLEDISAFYASQETTLEGADPALIELGQQIYRAGIPDLGVAALFSMSLANRCRRCAGRLPRPWRSACRVYSHPDESISLRRA